MPTSKVQATVSHTMALHCLPAAVPPAHATQRYCHLPNKFGPHSTSLLAWLPPSPPVCLPAEYNFDKPSAFDVDAILECLTALKQGRPYDVPVYDFTTHSRRWGSEVQAAGRLRLRLGSRLDGGSRELAGQATAPHASQLSTAYQKQRQTSRLAPRPLPLCLQLGDPACDACRRGGA